MFSATSWEEWRPILLSHTTTAALSLLHIVVIVLAGWLAVRGIRRSLVKLEHFLNRQHEHDTFVSRTAAEKRVKTLSGVLRTFGTITVWTIVFVSVFNEIGINIGPILAGVGIAGLAVGFGAQNLVKDVISGFFMILENQVRLGDIADVNGASGVVESISFRTIVLRDVAGVVHVFPHGSITTLANHTMYWSAYVMDVAIPDDEDIDRAVGIMRKVHEELSRDPEYGPRIIAPLEVFGVDHLGPSEIFIKIRIKTQPADQWVVGREFRRRLKYAFDREGIESPFPQRRVHITGPASLSQAVGGAAAG